MQIKGRLFPYPVLNHDKAASGYTSLDFKLQYSYDEDETNYYLRGVTFFTDSVSLCELIANGTVGVTLIVECSDTVIRKTFDITAEPHDIKLRKIDFTERVVVSLFAYAKEPFTLESDEVDEDYQGFAFAIEKYDILAAYDGFTLTFQHDESKDNVASSIFSVIPDNGRDDGKFLVECKPNDRRIVISLPKKEFAQYRDVQSSTVYQELFFNTLLVPALVVGLTECKKMAENASDLDEIGNTYRWFRSVCSSYKNFIGNGADLTLDIFKQMGSEELAQGLLGCPLGACLFKLKELMRPKGEVDDE